MRIYEFTLLNPTVSVQGNSTGYMRMPRIDEYANKVNYILNDTKKMIIVIIIVFFVVLDRFLKMLSLNYFNARPVKLIGDFFSLSFSSNYYIALSLPLRGIFLNIIIFGIIIFLIYYFVLVIKRKEALRPLFFFMIILGATSNFYDRVLYGFVIDYLDLKYFTAFNLADVMIVSGVMGLLIAIKNKA